MQHWSIITWDVTHILECYNNYTHFVHIRWENPENDRKYWIQDTKKQTCIACIFNLFLNNPFRLVILAQIKTWPQTNSFTRYNYFMLFYMIVLTWLEHHISIYRAFIIHSHISCSVTVVKTMFSKVYKTWHICPSCGV